MQRNFSSSHSLPALDAKSLSSSISTLSVVSERPVSHVSVNTIDTNISQALPEKGRNTKRSFPPISRAYLERRISDLIQENHMFSDRNALQDVQHLLDMVAVQVKHGFKEQKVKKVIPTVVVTDSDTPEPNDKQKKKTSDKKKRIGAVISRRGSLKPIPSKKLMSPLIENEK